MLLQEAGQRALQLTGAVAVNQPHDALIAEERFVEKPFRARDRFVDRAADHVEIAGHPFARLEIHLDADFRFRRRTADDPQLARARAHPLAADIEFGGPVVDGSHRRFEAETAYDDAITNSDIADCGLRIAD